MTNERGAYREVGFFFTYINVRKICELYRNVLSLHSFMEVLFGKEYLQDLFCKGKTDDKKHRFQPDIIRRYIRVVSYMQEVDNVSCLSRLHSLNYERLKGDKEGLSSVRVNDKYRIEFEEQIRDGEVFATICNIVELSNHYK